MRCRRSHLGQYFRRHGPSVHQLCSGPLRAPRCCCCCQSPSCLGPAQTDALSPCRRMKPHHGSKNLHTCDLRTHSPAASSQPAARLFECGAIGGPMDLFGIRAAPFLVLSSSYLSAALCAELPPPCRGRPARKRGCSSGIKHKRVAGFGAGEGQGAFLHLENSQIRIPHCSRVRLQRGAGGAGGKDQQGYVLRQPTGMVILLGCC